jgi:hypothetical protein
MFNKYPASLIFEIIFKYYLEFPFRNDFFLSGSIKMRRDIRPRSRCIIVANKK